MIKSVGEIREQFPYFDKAVNPRQTIYFDNAATTHKPYRVVERVNQMNSWLNGNVHRSPHYLGEESTRLYEESREEIQHFINARNREEIIFTSGTTASINLVANVLADSFLKEGDTVLISQAEHHSNIVPWQLVSKKKGIFLKVIPIDSDGIIDLEQLSKMITPDVKLISISHVSNVLGLLNPVVEIGKIAKQNSILYLVDGAQGIVHSRVDVQKIGCDFYAFSGHKIYGPTGIGILYGRLELLSTLPPWMGGGDMIESVSFKESTYAKPPLKFEAGTPNYIGAAGLGEAIRFTNSIDETFVKQHEITIIKSMIEGLREIPGMTLYGDKLDQKTTLFSFNIKGIHHYDLATLLDKSGVAVRSGFVCSEPLIRQLGAQGIVRASLMPFNTEEEIAIFLESLKRAIKLLI